MADFIESFVAIVPKLRGPIQLTGLVFTAICGSLIYHVDPNNTTALTVAGAIGVACLSIPLAFHTSILKLIPISQRVIFMITLISLLLFSFGALAVVTYRAYIKPTPSASNFDTKIATKHIKIFPRPDGSARIQLGIRFFPLSAQSAEGATVFTGVVNIHDQEKIKKAGLGEHTSATCAQIPSCVGGVVLSSLANNPLLVKSGGPGFDHILTVDVKYVPAVMKVWWEFYQREASNGGVCGFDNLQPAPPEGIPNLAMYRDTEKIADFCYASRSEYSFKTALLKE